MSIKVKKIDFHIHTWPNPYLETSFSFDIDVLKTYISKNSFDAIALTNHNRFDREQFLSIARDCSQLNCVIFPGIEISLEGGHILVIGDANIDTYSVLQAITDETTANEKDEHYTMSLEVFNSLVAGKNLLLIPHYYGKSPKVPKNIVESIEGGIAAGEAGNQKKFFSAKKENGPTPVCFSDLRMKHGLSADSLANFDKLTYVRVDGPITSSSLKKAFANKSNVSVGKSFLDGTFDILDGVAEANSGINVLIGERSSGKTHTLNRVFASLGGEDSKSVLYIRQFDIQKNAGDIKKTLQSKSVEAGKDYCAEFQNVIQYLDQIGIGEKESRVPLFLESLKKHAECSKVDEFAKAALYSFAADEVIHGPSKVKELKQHLGAILDTASPLSEVIERFLDRGRLISLWKELTRLERAEILNEKIKSIAQEIAKNVADRLASKSVSVPIERIDFSALLQARYSRRCFDKLVNGLKPKKIGDEDVFGRFRCVTKVGPIPSKRDMRTALGISQATNVDCLYLNSKTDAYIKVSSQPLAPHITADSRWRYFVGVSCSAINSYGAELSGGQSSEFCLLDRLRNHRKYQYVLIDELEPSFDNPFLNEKILPLLHQIAETATVFVSTHNNNLGVSLRPDHYIFHKVESDESGVHYRIFYGSSWGGILRDKNGAELPLRQVLMTTMEAGEKAYEERRTHYEDSED